MHTEEQRQCSRLHNELLEASRLLKLFHRIENAKPASELHARFQALVALESEVIAERQAQKQLTIDLQKATDQRGKLMQVSASLQEMNKAMQGKIEVLQRDYKSLEGELSDIRGVQLGKEIEQLTKSKSEAESQAAQLKKALDSLTSQLERDRTQWAREQQVHRTQEQKLIALVQQSERAQSLAKSQSSEVAEELTSLKSRLAEAVGAIQQTEALKSALVPFTQSAKDTQIAALERKCLRYERELKLQEDEQDL